MYTCGLTVYARGHIGNFRTFVCLDVLRRALQYLRAMAIHQVMNFTDVDDKTIAGARRPACRSASTRIGTSRRFARTRPRWASSRPRKHRARPTRRTSARWSR